MVTTKSALITRPAKKQAMHSSISQKKLTTTKNDTLAIIKDQLQSNELGLENRPITHRNNSTVIESNSK